MRKFYFSMLIVLGSLPVMAEWDPTPLDWTKGTGTAEDPYRLGTSEQLEELSRAVNEGTTFEDALFILKNDIDCEGKEIIAIGLLDKYQLDGQPQDDSKYFLGIFDGNYHQIDNFILTDAHVPEENKESIGGTGLFACSGEKTRIKNLTIGSRASVKGGLVSGGFIGQMNGGTLTRCIFKGEIEAAEYSGALIGVAESGIIYGCVNEGKMTGTTDIGGIAGQLAGQSTVSMCYNTGSVTATGFGGGGIVGATYEKASISNCYNIGSIKGQSNPWLGEPDGICASPGNKNISGCYNVKELAGVETKYGENVSESELKEIPEGLQPKESEEPDYGTETYVSPAGDENNGFPILSWQVSPQSSIEIPNLYLNNGSMDIQYYDMEGHPVTTPVKGNLLIRKHNNNVTKIIY